MSKSNWTTIRKIIGRDIGRPRRFSAKFLQSERQALKNYRSELRLRQIATKRRAYLAKNNDLTPTSCSANRESADVDDSYCLPKVITVGDRVLVCDHEKAVVSLGTVLSVVSAIRDEDSASYLIQFDRPDMESIFCSDLDLEIVDVEGDSIPSIMRCLLMQEDIQSQSSGFLTGIIKSSQTTDLNSASMYDSDGTGGTIDSYKFEKAVEMKPSKSELTRNISSSSNVPWSQDSILSSSNHSDNYSSSKLDHHNSNFSSYCSPLRSPSNSSLIGLWEAAFNASKSNPDMTDAFGLDSQYDHDGDSLEDRKLKRQRKQNFVAVEISEVDKEQILDKFVLVIAKVWPDVEALAKELVDSFTTESCEATITSNFEKQSGIGESEFLSCGESSGQVEASFTSHEEAFDDHEGKEYQPNQDSTTSECHTSEDDNDANNKNEFPALKPALVSFASSGNDNKDYIKKVYSINEHEKTFLIRSIASLIFLKYLKYYDTEAIQKLVKSALSSFGTSTTVLAGDCSKFGSKHGKDGIHSQDEGELELKKIQHVAGLKIGSNPSTAEIASRFSSANDQETHRFDDCASDVEWNEDDVIQTFFNVLFQALAMIVCGDPVEHESMCDLHQIMIESYLTMINC
jgi:hypothetical protein